MSGKWGVPVRASVNETNTHTDEELQSPEFRGGVKRLKLALRFAVRELAGDVGTAWTALHETAAEILEVDKGKEQAEIYLAKIQEFSNWQMTQPVNGSKN